MFYFDLIKLQKINYFRIWWTNKSDDYLVVYGMILQLENKFNKSIDVFKKVKYGDNRSSAFRFIADTYFQNKQYKNVFIYNIK